MAEVTAEDDVVNEEGVSVLDVEARPLDAWLDKELKEVEEALKAELSVPVTPVNVPWTGACDELVLDCAVVDESH